MGRGKRERRKAAGTRGTPPEAPTISDQVRVPDPGPRRRIRKIVLSVGAAVAVLAIVAGSWWWHSGRQPRAPLAGAPPSAHPPASYVGQRVCGQCHQQAEQGWRGSHHDLAMQPATDATVAGDFKNARFSYAGVTSTFSRRDGKFVVRTDGPDGALHDYDVKYTFGTAPLQQYLIEFPDGRLQALSIAWDTRPRAEGGQRWFHLYPGQNVNHRDELHWTGPSQNWNYMCAECHSTDVRKNYDPKTRRFATSYAEVNVACEACHGPGSNHVAWARKEGDGQRVDSGTKGLVVALRRSQGRHVDDRRRHGQCAADAAGSAGTRGRDVRALPRPPRPVLRRLRARPAPRRHAPGRAARGPPLLPRRADPRRGVRVRLVPAVQDVPPGRDVLGLPRPAQPEAPRAGVPGVPRLPRGAQVRGAGASLPSAGLARRRLHRLPHAHDHLHGGRSAPRSQPPHPAPGPLGEARRAQRVHAMPRRPPGRVGGQAGGGLVRAYPARIPALRRGARSGLDRRCGRDGAAAGRRPRRRPAGHRARELRSGASVRRRARRPSRSSARGSRTATRWCAARR